VTSHGTRRLQQSKRLRHQNTAPHQRPRPLHSRLFTLVGPLLPKQHTRSSVLLIPGPVSLAHQVFSPSLSRLCARAVPFIRLSRHLLLSPLSLSCRPTPSLLSHSLSKPCLLAPHTRFFSAPKSANKMDSEASDFSFDDESDGYVPEVVSEFEVPLLTVNQCYRECCLCLSAASKSAWLPAFKAFLSPHRCLRPHQTTTTTPPFRIATQ
jgi:hypothetical protein